MATVTRWLLLAATIAPAAAAAQATNDESRLIVGVGVGYIGGSSLWTVPNQPLPTTSGRVDELTLVRDLRGNITFTGQLTYFPTPRFGWTGEVTYIGLGTTDGCRLVVDNQDTFNRAACGAIAGKERAASAVAAMGGGIYRFSSRGDVQPYLRGTVGFGLVPRSTTAMTAFFGQDNTNGLIIYLEDDSKAIKPMGALSIGMSTAPSNGYQFRLEARATAVQLVSVSGPSELGSPFPPTESKWVVLPSIIVAFDVVLEKRRGRRY